MSNKVTPIRPNQPESVEIPAEHIAVTMNSILCEKLMQFERTLTPEGQWTWKGTNSKGEVFTDLFPIVDSADIALNLLTQVCQEQRWGFGIGLHPIEGYGQYKCTLFRLSAQGDPGVIADTRGRPLGLAVALALVYALGYNVPAHHRELFPGHYMKLHQ